jgi:signal transduction histidine kinase
MENSAPDIDTFYQQTQFVLEITDSVIWATDTDSQEFLWMEGAIESVFNVPFGQLVTRELFFENAVHPDDRPKVVEKVIDVEQGNSDQFQAEFRTNPKNGPVQWVEAHARFHENKDNQLLGISTAITERKQQEKRLQQQNERLEEFANIVSHDLRNPLNIASGSLEMAAEECDSEHLKHVEKAHERMSTLVEDVLTLAREGEAITDTEPIALGPLVEECWETVETGNAQLVTDTTQTIQGDRSRLKQLFENLIRNAVEHGGEEVTVTVGELAGGFYIEDDGSGIPEDERELIFDAGYSTSADGTGFGLSIIKQITDAHDWKINATDSDEGGARFEITNVEVNAE